MQWSNDLGGEACKKTGEDRSNVLDWDNNVYQPSYSKVILEKNIWTGLSQQAFLF